MNTVRIQKGFTLIELLIVIALLGSLAVGLLATIDPFEQLKKDAILPPEIQSQNFITQICVTTLPKQISLGVLLRHLPQQQFQVEVQILHLL